jgi:Flp pilus assembly protein TadB
MSKERAERRRLRELAAEQRELEQRAARERAAVRARRRAALRRFTFRRREAPVSARRKEIRATVGSLLLVVVVLTYLISGSVLIVIGVLLVSAVALPALAVTLFDRSRR